jgi:hypothetical protein
VYQACVEAFHYTGEKVDGKEIPKYRPEGTLVVSLGTGRFLRQDAHPNTILGWIKWTSELLDSASEQQTDLVWRTFPEMPALSS